VLLSGERDSHLLTGPVYVSLARQLRESRTLTEMLDASSGSGGPELLYALDRLVAAGLVREAAELAPPAAEGLWDCLGIDPDDATRAVGRASARILAVGDVSTSVVAASLRAAGVTAAVMTEDSGGLPIVLASDYLRPELAAMNERFLRDGTSWLLARLSGSTLWLGPFFRPGVTGCWECMAHRMRYHRLPQLLLQAQRHDSHPHLTAPHALPSTEAAAAALIATETLKIVAGVASPLEGMLVAFDLVTLSTERHRVPRRPQCHACGSGTASPPSPAIRLAAGGKTVAREGGFRTTTPEATLARFGHLVSRYTGVVSELTPVPGVDPGAVPLYLSGPSPAAADRSFETLRSRFRSASAGKGKTDAQAKASALCEALERYSGLFDGHEPRIRGSLAALGDAAIHPHDYLLFSDAQYASRGEALRSRSRRVPAPFRDDADVEWCALWSLTAERVRYLPAACCYYDYPQADDERFCWADSNGCAAGNTLEEAILQGFLELVERDSVAIWWFNRVSRPAVDLASFDDPYVDTLTQHYRSLGRELWVLDVTSDLAIPSFAAVSRRIDGGPEEITFGFGAHVDAHIGIVRALTEAGQFLPVITGPDQRPEVTSGGSDDEVLTWLRGAAVAEQSFLLPAAGPRLTRTDYRRCGDTDVQEVVEACVRMAASRGLEVMVLDQTRPDIGLPVVRVVVPGLRHFWHRLAPGRLYEVPVAMGWRDSPLNEDELNPIPVFF
jgi:bacteriocin biosynthesis cyclodehydratase domain-containing protein